MNQYYLISQLPGLDGMDGRQPLPIRFEEFAELVARNLGKKPVKILRNLTIIPDRTAESSGSKLIDSWYEEERQLRFALGNVRAAKMKKEFSAGEAALSISAVQAAKAAVEMTDPLSAELFLCQYRIDRLNDLRPNDPFSDDAVYFYGLKLMLLERMQKFDQQKGIAAYQKIYNSILNGDNQER